MRSDGISLSPHGAVSSCTGSHSLSSLLRIVSPACCHHSAQSSWSLWFCCSVCRTCRAHINHIKVFVLQETGGVMLNFAVELKCWGAGNSDGVGTSPAQGCQSVSLACCACPGKWKWTQEQELKQDPSYLDSPVRSNVASPISRHCSAHTVLHLPVDGFSKGLLLPNSGESWAWPRSHCLLLEEQILFFMFPCAGCVLSHFMHSHIYLVSVESDFLTVAPSNLVAIYFMYYSE